MGFVRTHCFTSRTRCRSKHTALTSPSARRKTGAPTLHGKTSMRVGPIPCIKGNRHKECFGYFSHGGVTENDFARLLTPLYANVIGAQAKIKVQQRNGKRPKRNITRFMPSYDLHVILTIRRNCGKQDNQSETSDFRVRYTATHLLGKDWFPSFRSDPQGHV